MLVLTRSANQRVMIGQDIVVTILEVRGDQVRIGISAPRDVSIHREELLDALEQANRSAASPSDESVRSLRSLPTRPEAGS